VSEQDNGVLSPVEHRQIREKVEAGLCLGMSEARRLLNTFGYLVREHGKGASLVEKLSSVVKLMIIGGGADRVDIPVEEFARVLGKDLQMTVLGGGPLGTAFVRIEVVGKEGTKEAAIPILGPDGRKING
jgi:hypothetical protein